MKQKTQIILVLTLLLILIALTQTSIQAQARTYEVNSTWTFRNALRHATDGDTILFTRTMTIDLNRISEYHNTNNNGQYLMSGEWDIINITLTIKANPGVTATITGVSIRLWNADDTTIENMDLQLPIWVWDHTDNARIINNRFTDANIELNHGSSNYIIKNNAFTNGGGIMIYNAPPVPQSNIEGNLIDGKPIIYITGSNTPQIDPSNIGQIIIAGGTNVHLDNLDLSNTTTEDPLIITQSSGTVVTQLTIHTSNDKQILVHHSTNTRLDHLDLSTQAKIKIEASPTIYITNSNINGRGIGYNIISVADSSDIHIENNQFTYWGDPIYITNTTNIKIRDNTFKHSTTYSFVKLEIRDSTDIEIMGNQFTTNSTIERTDMDYYYLTIMDSNNTQIINNIFTNKPKTSSGHRLTYMDGVKLIGEKTRDTTIEYNSFEWINNAIQIKNGPKNTNITHNNFTVTKTGILIRQQNSDKDIDNIEIHHNTFNYTGAPNRYYYALEFGEWTYGENLTVYMNAFINIPEIIYSYNHLMSNETFKSPEPVTYTYNGQTHTGYVGNYYNNYNGTDNNNDGVGDQPMTIVNNWLRRNIYQDPYPLVAIEIILGTPQQANNTGNQGNTNQTNTNLIIFNSEQRKTLSLAKETSENLNKNLTNLLDTGNHTKLTPDEVKKLLDENGIDEIVKKMVETGLIRKIIHIPESNIESLRRTLENIYGPLLINYPDPEGRIYLLYILYYN